MSEFRKCTGEVIRSANKNRVTDVGIDGKGDLLLQPINSKEEVINLANVIAGRDISDNLISLRRFVDVGLGIYLDNKELNIFDKETGETFLSGGYEKPNWIVTMVVRKGKENDRDLEYENYQCKARIINFVEFTEQTQKKEKSHDVLDSEGINDKSELEDTESAFRREFEGNLDQTTKNLESKEIFIDFDETILSRKIVELDKM